MTKLININSLNVSAPFIGNSDVRQAFVGPEHRERVIFCSITIGK